METPCSLEEITEGQTEGVGPLVVVLADLGTPWARQGEGDVPRRSRCGLHELRVQADERARQARSWPQRDVAEAQDAAEHVVGDIQPHHRHAATSKVLIREHLGPPQAQL